MKVNKFLITLSLSVFAGCVYASKPIEPIMVTIPAGSFDMGDRANQEAEPLRKVTLPEFSLGKYEVTVSEFRRFIEATGYKMPNTCHHEISSGWFTRTATPGSWQNNSINTSEYQPVNCVDFKAVESYVKWIGEETGLPYRLPTEAEWEYAARAGTTEKFYFGNDPEQTIACEYENVADLTGENVHQRDSGASFVNYLNAGGKSNCVDHAGYASIVGMYKGNPFGLHDMMSNVMEYTADCFVGELPMGGHATAKECKYRSLRGSDWHRNAKPISWRPMRLADFDAGGLEGFRLALDGKRTTDSSSTQIFAQELAQAQQREQQRRDAATPNPNPVTNVQLDKVDGVVILNWDESQQQGVQSYRVYRNDAPGTRFRLIAANIFDTQFKDANADFHAYEYSVVAVRNHEQSDYSELVTTQAGVTAKIPGRIEAEAAFTMSGESIRLKKTSDIEVGYSVTGRGGIPAGATLSFQVHVAQSGEYQLSYRVSSPRNTKGFIVLVNDKELTTSQIAETGGWNNWQTQKGNIVYLQDGEHSITVKSLDNNWKLNWLELQPK
ncbi:SUMF1/EgtB/PvdO family nonheme iron enzyme [Paraglaciecola sp.]|uniref:SUMF1/EgtB/PvdO family nonheme iron enzyme n=1 Tax=Paraglaciecola sp. TaxID=1920173 RepID=UPI003EF5788E